MVHNMAGSTIGLSYFHRENLFWLAEKGSDVNATQM